MAPFRLVEDKMGIFLVPVCKSSSESYTSMATKAAQGYKPQIPEGSSTSIMTLPLTIPAHWGTFVFGKITICNWPLTGTKTFDVHNKIDEDHKEKVSDLCRRSDGLVTFELPSEKDVDMVFMLGPKCNDDNLNGPVIVAKNFEHVRSQVNTVRAFLGLGSLHTDIKLHMSWCRLTGKMNDGTKDHQGLRALVEREWPIQESGLPEILTELPIAKKQKVSA